MLKNITTSFLYENKNVDIKFSAHDGLSGTAWKTVWKMWAYFRILNVNTV